MMQKKATGPIFVIFGGVFNLAASQEGGVYRGTHVQVAPYPKEHRKRDDYERVGRTAPAPCHLSMTLSTFYDPFYGQHGGMIVFVVLHPLSPKCQSPVRDSVSAVVRRIFCELLKKVSNFAGAVT